jgi:4-carboxymuconolactone decarboxylase
MKVLTPAGWIFLLVLPSVSPTQAEPQAGHAPPITSSGNMRKIEIAHSGSVPAVNAPAGHFTGIAHVITLFKPEGNQRAGGGLVTFERGARTAWHTHPLGQTLIVTDGVGCVQQWDGPVEIIRKGDVVRIPPNAKHWHGAAATTSMTHIAIAEQLEGRTVDWLEPVATISITDPDPKAKREKGRK